MNHKKEVMDAAKRRTTKLLKYVHNHDNEFHLLHGVLCMGFGIRYTENPSVDYDDYCLVNSVFDTGMISERLDKINRGNSEK